MDLCITMLPFWFEHGEEVVIGCSLPWFEGAGYKEATLENFNRWAAFRDMEATHLHKRSDYRGGVYWAVIRRKSL